MKLLVSAASLRVSAACCVSALLFWTAAVSADIGSSGQMLLLQGAGATFPAPLYKRWIKVYSDERPQVQIKYDAIGSGEGIQRFLAHAVDFGASDAALNDEQLAAAGEGVKMIPATAGLIALAYNLPGITEPLKLKRDVYVDMLLGRIKRWDDPRIAASNPGLTLPKRDIVRVVRRDSSGTTYAFTNHLSAISNDWRDRGPGVGKIVDWPGNAMAAPGNEGVSARIRLSVGAIGYVEYGQARRLGLAMALLENAAGQFVAPAETSGQAALKNNLSAMPANLRLFLPDPKGEEAYPIVTLSWLLLYPRYDGAGRADAVKDFVTWGLTEGQTHSRELGFLPLPDELLRLSRSAVASIH
ncbi:phosphate ABC transporter substrate-binding protein PstS [Methylotetracoccus oryzae]|uniref:phosphate ABC transporter substrate-binding protein PstS n=1 Tax=Methylotetracoccus oryzae TaxID=1919059 RepID=UPI00111A734E|nr:phosphate ABC transporter substrate-binding protein PstS [Methylotetracoccus oryzae]